MPDSPDSHLPASDKFLDVCEAAARAAGQVLLDWIGRFQAREKGKADLVTEADLAAQQVVRDHVLGAFPDHGLLGEEARETIRPESPYRWIIDPLDGTTNYVHGLPCYAVSLGLEHQGKIVAGTIYDPQRDECFTARAGGGAFLNGRPMHVSNTQSLADALVAASFPHRVERGAREIADFIEVLLASRAIRRMGSAAINLANVACGRFDAYWATDNKIWDVAAGELLVREAGGIITNVTGGPFNLERPKLIAAATPRLHAELCGLLNRAGTADKTA
jgi:myo-inositol-1(or 4)-monophosphatase